MPGAGDAVEVATLDLVFRGVAWPYGIADQLSLHTADPGDTGANEVVGGGYARQTGIWAAISAGPPTTTHLQDPVDFSNMPGVTITHWGAWTSGGIFVVGGTTTTRTMNPGDVYRLGTGTTVAVE